MLGMGWQEILLVVVIAVIVVGPKEVPRVLRTVSYWFRKFREMAREFQSGIDDVIREADLVELQKELDTGISAEFSENIINTVDPTGAVKGEVDELKKSVASPVDEKFREEQDGMVSGEVRKDGQVANAQVEEALDDSSGESVEESKQIRGHV